MIIISGTGRSGTKLIHTVLSELGVDVGKHEISLGNDGGVGGYRVLNKMIHNTDNIKIFNQLRNPVDVIKSSILSKNLIDYPELDIYRNKYPSVELYLMNLWLNINTYLCDISEFNYTLEQLNDGKVTNKLIESLNIKCDSFEFNNKLVNTKLDSNKNNTRVNSNKYGNHITEEFLMKLDSNTYIKRMELYNKIN